MIFPVTPLKKMRETQPFGVDWTSPPQPSYKSLGLKGHNGIDLRAPIGTPIYAVANGNLRVTGSVDDPGYGLAARLNVPLGDRRFIECIYGHLSSTIITPIKGEVMVNAGDVIGHTGTSGNSSGPHLHFGTRFVYYKPGGAGPFVENSDNGFTGSVDPKQFLSSDAFALPVDLKYGLPEQARGYSDLEFYKVAAWVFLQTRKLPTTRLKNALIWGRWDYRTVNDPAMFGIWSEMTKPEAHKQHII